MKQLFMQHTMLTGAMVLLLVLSITCQIIIGSLYQNMIKETDNMSSTENKLLKQCKLKFANCFQMNAGVANIPVFVDKFLNRIRFMGITLTGLHHLSGQFMLLSVFVGGIGACRGIAGGESIKQILPFYIFSFFGLYLYFSVTAMIDMQAKRRILKTNLIDYLENHMVSRLVLSTEEIERLDRAAAAQVKDKSPELKERPGKVYGFDKTEQFGKAKQFGKAEKFSKAEQEELEELLKEFLV